MHRVIISSLILQILCQDCHKVTKYILSLVMVYHGISNKSLVLSQYNMHKPLDESVYQENTTDQWDIHVCHIKIQIGPCARSDWSKTHILSEYKTQKKRSLRSRHIKGRGQGRRKRKKWRCGGGKGTPAIKAASFASPPTVLR